MNSKHNALKFEKSALIEAVKQFVDSVSERTLLRNMTMLEQLQICAEMEVASKETVDTIKALGAPFCSVERSLSRYLGDGDPSNASMDCAFHGQMVDAMAIAFSIPDGLSAVIQIHDFCTVEAQREILDKFSTVDAAKTVLVIDTKRNAFCVCSARIGIIEIHHQSTAMDKGPFQRTFDCIARLGAKHSRWLGHFQSIYSEWKRGGVRHHCIPPEDGRQRGCELKHSNFWVNGCIAFLFLILDLCGVHAVDADLCLHSVIHCEVGAWNYSLPIRMLHAIFSRIDQQKKRRSTVF